MQLPSILKGKDMPKHLVVNSFGLEKWAIKKGKKIEDVLDENKKRLNEMIDNQLRKDIPVLSINIKAATDNELESTKEFLRSLSKDERISEKKVRIYVIGNWYELESDLVDSIKQLMESTSNYDNYFLNLMINYDGQGEILSAMRLLVKKAETEKVHHEEVTKETIKDNLPSSYFIPPELIIENQNSFSGTLLWDCVGASIYFTRKPWAEFEKSDFEKALNFHNGEK